MNAENRNLLQNLMQKSNDLAPFVSNYQKEWGRLQNLKDRKVYTDPEDIKKLQLEINECKTLAQKYIQEFEELQKTINALYEHEKKEKSYETIKISTRKS